MSIQVFAFAKIIDLPARAKVYSEIRTGKSRFGMWDQEVSLRERYHGANGFLLKIKAGDWIVHVNSPKYGRCVAVRAIGPYEFDDGIKCEWGTDFNNYIPVAPETAIEFDRNDKNILPSVNLRPMRRGQRILQVEDFIQSLDNIKTKKVSDSESELRGVIHLREKIETEMLPQITNYIHELNRSKEFERFLHLIFDNMPNVVSIQNGFGWKTDYGADLIVEFQNPLAGVSLSSKLVVQAKSYTGSHYELNAIDQIVEGIKKYNGDGGLLITTGLATEDLEEYAQKKSEEIGKPIDIIAGSEVAKFVMRHAPEMLIGAIDI